MSFRIKLPSRKTLANEEQLISGMERLWLAIQGNRVGLLIGLLVALLAAGMIVGVVWYDHQQGEQAYALDEEAGRFYVTRPGDDPDRASKNLRQAISRYRRVAKEFPRSAIAPHSLYRLGLALEQDKDIDGAIRAYEDFHARYGSNALLLGLVYQRLGYAYLTKGEQEKAEQAFTAILAVPGALNKDYALFEMAKMEETQSRAEGALAYYQDLKQNYPRSPLVGEAEVRIKALELKEEKPAGESEAEEGAEDVPTEEAAE